MPTTRAKFRCVSVETFHANDPDGQRNYRFSAEYDTTIPEDQRYAKYTPIGNVSITVTNPNVSFEPGKSYYLDFTPVDAA
jgi:hypothetical protein